MTDSCFKEPKVINVVLGIGIMVGTTLCYLPQIIKIVQRRSHAGLSFLMVWINIVGNCANTVSSVIDRWDNFLCCEHISFWECNEGILVQEQLALNTIALFIIYVFALVFFENDGTNARTKRFAWLGLVLELIVVAIFIGIAAAFIVCFGGDGDETNIYGDYVLGVIAAAHPILTWTPQIWTTYKRKSQGSLSLIMLLVLLPGAILVAFFQGFLNEEYIVAIPAIIASLELAVLVYLVLYYNFLHWRARKAEEKAKQALREESSLLGATSSDEEGQERTGKNIQ